MKNLFNLSILLLAVALCMVPVPVAAQTPVTSTTTSGALTASTTNVCVASATSIVLPSISGNASGSIFMVDNEAMQVARQGTTSTCYNVRRGVLGTRAAAHASGVTVWVLGATTSSGDPSRPFTTSDFLATYKYSPGSQYSTPMSPISAAAVTQVAGTNWIVQINIPNSTILKGACVRNGATVGTDKWILSIYDNTGALLANTTTAGTLTAGASIYQCIAFTSPIAVVGPATYFLGAQGNGTTDNVGTYATGSLPSNYGATSVAGTFGTLPAIAPPVTFTASKGPYMFVY